MTVVRTDNWIAESQGDPWKVCQYLTQYFPTASALEIHDHLTMYGMYFSSEQGKELGKLLNANHTWEISAKELERLRSDWNGPSVPVFIFPSDSDNKQLIDEFNGKSGLSYGDKLFLFISPLNTETEIKALLTHEYNHVCRLNKFLKREKEYTLLDTIILEGLAEMAVEERFGKISTSIWTSLYSEQQLAKLWKDYVYPNRNHLKESDTHEEVLYGLGDYPHMAGYCVGYYLVQNFLKDTELHAGDLLELPSTRIAKLS
ncbi:DUF2268 domain-containing protein [Sporosarcina sp. ACRSL]|uniref:DUF2268 domain-containing protein n=1 Tax=Sporosarcina sp. ACRSL TaxID=2918215 RepID=UPI001EF71CF7|nr:DUF2268 domain-containing putative Zn-dependent protease [Sporosarcina sp. ACRSL]MCG7345936.1 DUF2268 domain-containing protein [Sporosarcina sp. ACRSL]